MRRSRFFLPTLKETPAEAQIVSHRLMLRAGMIQQASAGIYSWLPLGHRVLRKVEQIVREEQDRAGAVEMLMPTIQSADLWRESGRYDDYGLEMLRITDRHERDMLFGPTNEELIVDIFRNHVRSYRELPKLLYHIQWKFRDEVRPRFGVMRGREFLMKDAYSFDADYAGARRSYNRMFVSYLKTFARMGLRAIPMEADTGPIGGDLSHEFIILAETGESEVFCHRGWLEVDVLGETVDYEADLQPLVDNWTRLYAATDEKHDPNGEGVPPEAELVHTRGVEVGHIFYFGTKYSKPMNAVVTGAGGVGETPVEMGSYGIGVSRLVGAIIEASHDGKGIVWPEPVAPFGVGLVNLRTNDEACVAASDALYAQLEEAGVEVLYDDRDERAGVKFADMELIGLPWQVVVGPRGVQAGTIELKSRRTGEAEEIPAADAVKRLSNLFTGG
ncbi:MAG: proline--tRNA ligase [Acetobacterales bacterium]